MKHELIENSTYDYLNIFGHSSSAITLRYIGVAEDDVRAAYQSVSIDVYGEDS